MKATDKKKKKRLLFSKVVLGPLADFLCVALIVFYYLKIIKLRLGKFLLKRKLERNKQANSHFQPLSEFEADHGC